MVGNCFVVSGKVFKFFSVAYRKASSCFGFWIQNILLATLQILLHLGQNYSRHLVENNFVAAFNNNFAVATTTVFFGRLRFL